MTARPEFDAAIAVEGVRPAWLPDELWDQVEATLYCGEVQQCIPGATNPVMSDWEWSDIKFIKLPVPRYDFVYLALARGMVPWFGGDEAPADWDIGRRPNALWRDGTEAFHYEPHWDHGNDPADIIGYPRKATSTALPLAHPAAPQGEEGADNLEAQRCAIEACARIADAHAEPTDTPSESTTAYEHAARRIARSIRRLLPNAALAPAAIASGREGAE